MIQADYFFLIFLGTIAISRFTTAFKVAGPTIRGFRLRHYMLGIVVIVIAFFIHNLALYSIALGLIIDEIPTILVKGLGYRDAQWRGCEDYHSSWCVAGVLVLVLLVYIFRASITGLV